MPVTTLSNQPPKYPASSPKVTPIVTAISAPSTPTSSDTRVP